MAFNLAWVISAADSGDFDGVVLTATSASLISSALDYLSNTNNWVGASYDLTDSEIDEIDEIIGQLSLDITS